MKEIIIKLNEKIKFMLVLLCIIVVWAVRLFPFKFGGWNQIMLAFSYRYGFIQRAFIGSCIDVISTALHIPLKYMRYIYGIVTMLIFTSVMLLFAYKSQSKNGMDSQVKIFLQGLMLLFLLGPGWNTNYNNFAHESPRYAQACRDSASFNLIKETDNKPTTINNNLIKSKTAMWLSCSSVGRKFVMALTGAALVLFVTFHCLMNAVAICWQASYYSI